MSPSNKANALKAQAAKDTGPESILKRMIGLVDELITVMEAEVPLIEGRRRAEHAELLKRKQRLAIDYRASIKSLTANPEFLKQVPEDLRVKAKAAVQRLTEASERNAKILRGAITALQRLIQMIIAIVKDEVLPKVGYANPNKGLIGHNLYSPTCKPVTVSRTA